MGPQGPSRVLGAIFGPSGPRKVILYENTYLRKTQFLAPKLTFLPTNWAKMGATGGVYRVNCGFFEGPRPFGSRNNANKKKFGKKIFGLFWPKKDLEKFWAWPPPKNRPKWARKGPVGFWGPCQALLGPFLTPLGLSVGPNVHILSFWRYQIHLEPNGK